MRASHVPRRRLAVPDVAPLLERAGPPHYFLSLLLSYRSVFLPLSRQSRGPHAFLVFILNVALVDIHDAGLSATGDDSLVRAGRGEIKGEVVLIFGVQDGHIPKEGRSLIRETLTSPALQPPLKLSFLELQVLFSSLSLLPIMF